MSDWMKGHPNDKSPIYQGIGCFLLLAGIALIICVVEYWKRH